MLFPCANSESQTCWAANKLGKVESTDGDVLTFLLLLTEDSATKMTSEHYNVFPRSLGKLLMVALPGLSFGARQEARFLFCKILGLKTNKQTKKGVYPYL